MTSPRQARYFKAKHQAGLIMDKLGPSLQSLVQTRPEFNQVLPELSRFLQSMLFQSFDSLSQKDLNGVIKGSILSSYQL